MNILIPDSWLREYLKTKATPKQIKNCLSLCGPSVERINQAEGDFIYDIEITSNRVDMASVYGIAREAAAILPRFNIKASLNNLKTSEPPQVNDTLPMEIFDPEKICNRILGIVMEVNPIKPSPKYIKDRIEKCNVRSLNNLVDITNYVMLEVGHPCHVFDYDRIKTHSFLIRKAKKGEPIITLDEKKYLLSGEDVIIDDGTGRVIDLPGIMGTENSVVTKDTRRIFFFIESNNPVLIRKTSLRYGIRTMAAIINEKHPGPELAKTALLYGIGLYQKIAGGKLRSNVIDIFPNKPTTSSVNISVEFINERLGIKLAKNEIISILKSLNFGVEEVNENLTITPPSYRQFDIKIKEDIVEEVARIYGYHNLPNKLMEGKIPLAQRPLDLVIEEKTKNILKYWGLTEIYNYSMSNHKTDLKIANPLTAELVYLRSSLVPQMLDVISQNKSIRDKLSLFELSKVYVPQKNLLPNEPTKLCIGFYNRNFYELKGLIEGLFSELGIKAEFKPSTDNKQKADIFINISLAGWIENNEVNNICISYLDFETIVNNANLSKKYISIPNYPPIVEDFSFVVKPQTYVGDLMDAVKKTDQLIVDVSLLDSFENTRTLRVKYQNPNKTLSEKEIKPIREKILKVANIKV